MLAPLLGSAGAATLFGVALLCCGLNSTVTATLSGQIVMEGFINVRLPAWARRLATRGLAIIPASIGIVLYGESGLGKLLILSQVILSMQLPFAIVPLVMFTADKRKMGVLVAPRWVTALAVARRRGRDRAQPQGALRSRCRLAALLRRSRRRLGGCACASSTASRRCWRAM